MEGEIDSDTESLMVEEYCTDCVRTHREREKNEKMLTKNGQRQRFRAHQFWPHEQTWLNYYNKKFLYCAKCLCILISIQEDYGTLIQYSDTELWKQLCGNYSPPLSATNTNCTYSENSVLAYYVLGNYSQCVFEDISIWVNANINLSKLINFRYNPNYVRDGCVRSWTQSWSFQPQTPSLTKNIDTHFIHCGNCLNGPIGYLELSESIGKPICYFVIDNNIGMGGKKKPKRKKIPLLHHYSLPIENFHNRY